MTADLVLLTGASGHMGFRTLVNALSAGYIVRAAVRTQAKADEVLAAKSIKDFNPGSQLTFHLVPDILAPGAYDTAVKGVKYIIHTASPIANPSDDDEKNIIQPAVQGTLRMLEAASKAPSVKKVVITSSVIAVVPWMDFIGVENPRIFTANDVVDDSEVSGPYDNVFQAYAASKVKALNATTRFVKTEKPSFDVVNLMPGFFIGKSELVTESKKILSGTNRVAFSPVLGKKADIANPGTMNHVDDVAKVHVLALRKDVKGAQIQNFGLQSDGIDGAIWGTTVDIVKKHFPEAVKAGILPANGTQPTKRLRYDVSETEKVLGIKFRSYEDQVVSVTEHYLELLEKEKGGKTTSVTDGASNGAAIATH